MKVLQTTILGVLVLAISFAQGLEIRPCADNGTSAVEEGSKDFILACAGLNAAQPTVWKYRDRYPLGTQIIANCSKTTCSLPYSPLILSIINEHTQRSHMIIPDVLRGRFPDGTWTCENDGQTAQCALDVIYTATDVECHVIVNENASVVTGVCQTSKMYSSAGQYSCRWFEGSANQREVEIPSSETNFTLTNCSVGAMEYFCGNCSFHKSLPNATQSYSYRVVISPGKTSPTVAYTIVKTQTKEASSLQATPTTSATPVTSGNPVTSANPVKSANTVTSTVPRMHTTSSDQGVVIDEGEVTTARYEGVGIGVALLLAVILVVVVVVFVICRCRRRQKKPDGELAFVNEDYHQLERRGDSCANGLPSAHLPASSDPRLSSTNTTESDYTAIGTVCQDSDRTSTTSYLRPVPTRDSTTVVKGLLGSNGDGVGGNSIRALPDLPAECTISIDTTGCEQPAGATGNCKPEVDGHTGHKAHRDDTYKGRISPDLPTVCTGCGPQCNSSFTPPPGDFGDFGKCRTEEERTEIENVRNENTEKTAVSFLDSGFQEKGAEYIYMKPQNIPLSDPL